MNRSFRLILGALAALGIALALAACGDDKKDESTSGGGGAPAGEVIKKDPANAGKSITVGSKNFTEQFILGQIYAQALEAAGFKVKKELNLGSEQIAYKALKAGQVDGYPEYTGTSLTSFFGVKTAEVPRNPDQAYDLARKEYAKEGITALPRTAFENKYVLTTTKEKQKDLLKGATKVSDVAKLPDADKLRVAGFPECRQRTDCLLGLKNVYDWTPKFVSSQGQYDDLDQGQSDFTFGFSTDGPLSTDKYVTYEDDKQLFPPYYVTFMVRNAGIEKLGDSGRQVIESVQEPLTEEVMQELNSRVTLDKQEPEGVAADYLKEAGFVE